MAARRDFGSVRLLSTGRYQARYVDRSGVRHARSFASRGDVSRYLAGMRVDLDRGDWLDPRSASCSSRLTYAAEWLERRRVNGRPLSPHPGAVRQPAPSPDQAGDRQAPAPLPRPGRHPKPAWRAHGHPGCRPLDRGALLPEKVGDGRALVDALPTQGGGLQRGRAQPVDARRVVGLVPRCLRVHEEVRQAH